MKRGHKYYEGGVIFVLNQLRNLNQAVSSPLSVPSWQRCPQGKGLESMAPLVRSVEETPDPIPTTVTGTIPTWIKGSFLRNGPGKFEFGKDRYLKNTFTQRIFCKNGSTDLWLKM